MASKNSRVSLGCVCINGTLPNELVGKILSELSVAEQMACMSVCKWWQEVIKSLLRINKTMIIQVAHKPDVCGLTRVLTLCPALTHLDLKNMLLGSLPAVPWGFVPTVTEYCKQLRVLKLLNVCFSVDESVVLAEGLTALEHVEAERCHLTDQFLTALFASCRRLKVLDVAGNPAGITPAPFSGAPAGLEQLDISGCVRVDDGVFVKLLTRCQHTLRHVNASHCEALTAHCVDLVAQFPNLQHLDMSCMPWRECSSAAGRAGLSARLSALSKLRVLKVGGYRG